MFNILNLETKSFYEIGGTVQIYSSGADAARIARELTESTGVKHQPRLIASTVDWRERERQRFLDGTYIPVPWSNHAGGYPAIPDHFVHMSVEEPGKISFTEDSDKGAADRQTRMRPGRYLERFYGGDDGGGWNNAVDKRQYWTNECARLYDPCDVHFAKTQDDIVRVYLNGPRSCMSRPAKYYVDGHPTRVYAAGDLEIAYLKSQDDESRIVARCVCWPAKKVYSTIYGDSVRLEAGLEKLGFHEDNGGELYGARLLAIECGNGYVVPYVDNYSQLAVRGEYLVISYGDIDAQVTEGISGDINRCERCNDVMSDEDSYYVEDIGVSWCETCYCDHTFRCDGTDRIYSDHTESYTLEDGRVWCADYFERHGATCEATGAHIDIDDSVTLSDGTVWSASHFERHGFQCRKCGECFALDDRCEDCSDETPEIAGRDESPDQLELSHI